jgi:hypothetical protein
MPTSTRLSVTRQVELEQAWRAKVGDDAFERTLNVIIEMAGNALDRPNGAAARALWSAARRRRATRSATPCAAD